MPLTFGFILRDVFGQVAEVDEIGEGAQHNNRIFNRQRSQQSRQFRLIGPQALVVAAERQTADRFDQAE
ncbi:hypothetical protein FQZ97_1165020 [compost metagenome]